MSDLGFIPDHVVTATRAAMLAHGYQPVPLVTNLKRPINEGWPLIVGVPELNRSLLNTGFNGKGFRIIDSDVDTPKDAFTVRQLVKQFFGETPLVRTREGTNRFAMVFRGPGAKRIIKQTFVDSRGKKAARWQVELLGEGNQLHAYGRHPDGQFPEWGDDGEPANFPAGDLPLFNEANWEAFHDALTEALGADPREGLHLPPAPVRPGPVAGARLPSPPPTEAKRYQANAAAALAAEAAIVRDAGQGGRNAALYQAAMKLGHHVGAGVLTEGDVFRALEAAADANGLTKDAKGGGMRGVRATIASGVKIGRKEPTQLAASDPDNIAGPTLAKHEADKLRKLPQAPANTVRLFGEGKDWTRPLGILGELTEWILSTSRRPNRPLAVAASTAVLSALCSRHLFSATGTAMNLFIACLAETAVGKDRPFSAVAEVLHAIKLPGLHATAKAFSVSAFEAILIDKPCCVATVDEMSSQLLARISNRRATLHEASIKPFLLENWSREIGKGPFMTTARASVKSISIESPSLTLFGASTPDSFYSALTSENVTDGFMNRFLLAPAAPRAAKSASSERKPLPQFIIDTLQGIVPNVSGKGDIADAYGVFSGIKSDIQGVKIPWASEEVERIANELEENILVMSDQKAPGYELWGRTYEYSIRLAGIHAVSRRGLDAILDLVDLEFGAGWAIASARSMIAESRDRMSASEYEANFNMVRALIRKHGLISSREILRNIRSINQRERDAILVHLEQAGLAQKIGVDGKAEWKWTG